MPVPLIVYSGTSYPLSVRNSWNAWVRHESPPTTHNFTNECVLTNHLNTQAILYNRFNIILHSCSRPTKRFFYVAYRLRLVHSVFWCSLIFGPWWNLFHIRDSTDIHICIFRDRGKIVDSRNVSSICLSKTNIKTSNLFHIPLILCDRP